MLKCKMRTGRIDFNSNGAGVVASATGIASIGGLIVALPDFTNIANVFDRFTITRSRIWIIPYVNNLVVLRGSLDVGFLNDGVLALPATSNSVAA